MLFRAKRIYTEPWTLGLKVAVFVLFWLTILPLSANADAPYYSYYFNPATKETLSVPTPYEPLQYIQIEQQAGEGGLKNPKDLFIDEENRLYIADTGNNRVLVTDRSGQVLRTIGLGELNNPTGVFVRKNGLILVADSGNNRIVEYTQEGSINREYKAPVSPLLGSGFSYHPIKIVVDSRDYMYVVSQGNQKGLIMLDSEGEFRGFFGANRVQASFSDIVIRMIYSREQRKTVVNLPFSFNNVAMSGDGFLYATTSGLRGNQVRKLNAVGSDILPDAGRDFADPTLTSSTVKQNFTDVALDSYGNMTIIDNQYGRMYQYDANGRLLFVFGDKGNELGKVMNPSAIEFDSEGILYALDEAKNGIQTFRPTHFTRLVHEALLLYNEGHYEKAEEPWAEVLKLHSYYDLALQAMGQIKMRQGKSAEAMDYFKKVNDKSGYSEAYYEQRRMNARSHFEQAATPLLLSIIALYGTQKLLRRRKMSIGKWLDRTPLGWFRLPLRVMFHPVAGFEALRYEGKGRIRDALVLVSLYVIVKIVYLLTVGYLYEETPLVYIQWTKEIFFAILPWLLWSICNYALTTISDGEGRFRDVLTASAYCLMPSIVFMLPLALLTRVLTIAEKDFFDLFSLVINGWGIILLFFSVRETHSYQTFKTVWIMIATALGCLFVLGLYSVMYGLALQVTEWIEQIVKEVIYIGS